MSRKNEITEKEILAEAEYLASSFAKNRINSNELEKVIVILKQRLSEGSTDPFGELYTLLIRFNKTSHFQRSGQIKRYYQSIHDELKRTNFKNVEHAIRVLGWTRRLLN